MLVFIIETLNFLFLKKVFVGLNQRVISTLMCLDQFIYQKKNLKWPGNIDGGKNNKD